MVTIVDTKVYAVINTTDYNCDGKASVQIAMGEENAQALGWSMSSMGWSEKRKSDIRVKDLEIGEMILSDEYYGAYIMRIA